MASWAVSVLLGPFVLEEPIGRGGIAEVWRAAHKEEGTPAAIKVITSKHARSARFTATFKTEVHAVARLSHPAIVTVLDQGLVSEAAERGTKGRLVAGSPYLAMELASLGALDRAKLPLDWNDTYRVLMTLLDALAHAHARGVVHRDLKLANVLISASTDLRPGLKLTDFGIAHALGHDMNPGQQDSTATGGTPAYMAPEQFLAEWREFGPWTDLYALGCMAHVLVTGAQPFRGSSPLEVARSHLYDPPPTLSSPFPLPAAFEAFVARLLAKEPIDRFQRAADAAWALRNIDEVHRKAIGQRRETTLDPATRGAELVDLLENQPVRPQEEPTAADVPAEAPTTLEIALPSGATRHETLVDDTRISLVTRWADLPDQTGSSAPLPKTMVEPSLSMLPPLPDTWRHPEPPPEPPALLGAGLGLYGLRAIPLVDRELERDRLWAALAEVRGKSEPRAVIVSGGPGVGKTRLVEWVTERADEVGSALVLRAGHSPIAGSSDGLSRMLGRFMQLVDMRRPELDERVRTRLAARGLSSAYEAAGLAEILSPADQGEGGGLPMVVRFANDRERHVLIHRILAQLGFERPVVVWIDDAQWGADALTFVKQVLESSGRGPEPILFLITVREDLIAERPVEAALLTAIEKTPRARRVELPPLGPDDHRRLVEELLLLEGELAEQVSMRTEGNPLFAVTLVGDWVARGVLRVGKRGFVLKAGEKAVIPDRIHELWSTRVERLVELRGASVLPALEMASLLGNEVEAIEWKMACQEAGIALPESLAADLANVRLVAVTASGFSFVHGMARESIERELMASSSRAHTAGLHSAIVRMLEKRWALETRGVAERIAEHLILAGRREEAVDPFLRAAKERHELGATERALILLDTREQLLDKLGAGPVDVRRGEAWILRAQIALVEGRPDEVELWSARAEASAKEASSKTLELATLRTRAMLAYERSDLSTARGYYERMRDLATKARIKESQVDAVLGLADVTYRFGDLAAAGKQYEQALLLAETAQARARSAHALWGLGYVELWRGDLGKAEKYFRRQESILSDLGIRLGVARAESALGEVARISGDLSAAEAWYRKALASHQAIGSSEAHVVELNLAMVLIQRREFRAALGLIEPIIAAFSRDDARGDLSAAYVQCLPCRAGLRDWRGWDLDFAESIRLLQEVPQRDGDVAAMMELAGDQALEAKEHDRARAAYQVALDHWTTLGRADRASALRVKLTAMA
ncbi:MAG: protein kinase [Myxococcota bacterium]